MEENRSARLWGALMAIRKYSVPPHRETDIHMGEWMILRLIAQEDSGSGEQACVSDVHGKLELSKPAVSQLLNGLENKGYIKRDIHAGDRRRIALTLTPEGQSVLERFQRAQEQYSREIARRFGEEKTEQLVELLSGLSEIMRDYQREIKEKKSE